MVFAGTGTAGAYHAGVLRALIEAGVRIDLVAGRGMGAASALFAAVDAAPRLWDAAGGWRHRAGLRGLYRWRLPWRVLGASLLVAASLLAVPLAALAALAFVYPLLLLLGLLWPAGGAAVVDRWREVAAWVSGPDVIASLVPRLVTAAVLVAAGTALGLWGWARWQLRTARQQRGLLWWKALGAPFDAEGAARWAVDGFWRFMRGAASIEPPPVPELSRRYAELLGENLGQPGYRELMLLAHDLDSHHDVVFALLSDPWRKRFTARAAEGAAGELIDLAGAARVHVLDALAAAVSPPGMCDPHAVRFLPESFWRGETHRLCDRPGATSRLVLEAIDAGATQVILVSALSPLTGPHALAHPAAAPRDRLGEVIASFEVAAAADAVTSVGGLPAVLFHIRPAHNPVSPFAFGGGADERSHRLVAIGELLERGYEDAYRQFLDPVIGASGEQIHGATVVGPTPQPDDPSLHPSSGA